MTKSLWGLGVRYNLECYYKILLRLDRGPVTSYDIRKDIPEWGKWTRSWRLECGGHVKGKNVERYRSCGKKCEAARLPPSIIPSFIEIKGETPETQRGLFKISFPPYCHSNPNRPPFPTSPLRLSKMHFSMTVLFLSISVMSQLASAITIGWHCGEQAPCTDSVRYSRPQSPPWTNVMVTVR